MREGTASEHVDLPLPPVALVPGRGHATEPGASVVDPSAIVPVVADPAEELALVVLESPGVVRIEPDFRQAMARLRGVAGSEGDRVTVTLDDDRLDLEVDIVVDPTVTSALVTVMILHERLVAAIRRLHHTPGEISVTVLDLLVPEPV